MAEYIERTEELMLAMNAGARAIENTKRYHSSIYTKDVFSESPQEIPYLQAAKVLREVSDAPAADVATVVHGRKIEDGDIGCFWLCSLCGECCRMVRITAPTAGQRWTEVVRMRLIDADALPKLLDAEYKQTMKLIWEGEKHLDNLAEGFTEASHIAKYIAPTVDAVPVVRCKDCKYSCKDGNGRSCEGYWYELSEYDVTVKDDDFCSYGEGKDYD